MIAGIGGIALIVFLFFDWISGISGWDSFEGGINGFIVALAGVTAVKFAGIAAMGKRLNVGIPRGGITLLLGTLATLLIIYRWLSAPPEAEIDFGLFLGLAAAAATAIGALLALREGGWEPLVNVSGSARRATSSSSSSRATTKKAAAKKAPAKKRAAKRSSR